jgi:hypothetical protein
MSRFLKISALVIALTITGCSSASKKAGPLDGFWQNKGKTYSNKRFTKPKRWSPGQYVVVGTIDDGDKESVTKSLVVRREAGGWVFETITTNEDNEVSGMQMLIKGYEQATSKGDTSKIKVIWLKVLSKDGQVTRIDGDTLMLYNMMIQSTWSKIIIAGAKFTTGGAVNVPAGNFAGTTKVHTSVKILFSTFEGDSWMHPDVPVNGVVKTVSDDIVTELIDFGYNGKATIN